MAQQIDTSLITPTTIFPEEEQPTNASGATVIPTASITDAGSDPDFPRTDTEKHTTWYQHIYNNMERTYLAGFNEQVADMLQTPISAGLELYQMGFGGNVNPNLPNYDPDDHIVGARAVKDLFEGIGINVTPEEDSLGARIGQETAYGLAGYGVVGAAAKGTKYTYGMFEPVLSFVRSKPLTALLVDVGISVPAGAGGHVGEKIGGETGEALGVIAGATLPAFLSPGYTLAKATIQGTKRARTALGLGQEGKTRQAKDTLLANMSDESLEKLRSGELDAPSVGKYTTAELLDDPSLLEAQAAVSARSPDSRTAADASRLETSKVLRSELDRLDPGEVGPTNYVRTRIASAAKAVQKRMELAVARAQEKIDRLTPNSSIDVVGKIAREEFDKVYGTAREGEKSIWKTVGSGQFETDTITRAAREIVEATPRLSGEGGQADIPLAIREIAGKDAVIDPSTGKEVEAAVPSILQKTESADEIQALMARLGDDQRIARAEGKLNRARMIGELRDSIFERIMPTSGASPELSAARAYSRRLNEVFYHGPLGQLLDKTTKGGYTVSPELTLERLIGSGTSGKVGAQSLRDAATQYGGTEKVDSLISEFLIAKFASKVMAGGEFNPSTANRFVSSHSALELFPQLRAQMLDAAKGKQLANSVSKSRSALLKRVENQSLAYKFLEGVEPSAAINAALKSKTPTKDINSLVTLAKKDPSGNTLKGIQAALFEVLTDRFGAQGVGEFVLTPNKMKTFLDNKTNQHMIRSVFGNDAIKLLNQVVRGASFKDRSRSVAQSLRGVENQTLDRLTSGGGTLGALMGGNLSKVGATYSGKGLLLSGIGRRFVQKTVKSVAEGRREDVMVILERALNNPEFARELVKPISQINTAKGEMSLRRFAILNELLGETPDAIFATSEELMP